MIFAAPTPFAEAAASHEVRALLPTSMSSAELDRLGQGVLRRSLFAARLDNAQDLQFLKDRIADLIAGKIDFGTVRQEWQDRLDARGYTAPSEDEEDTITDLRGERRTNLILQTNVQMAQGYGRWLQGQDQAILDHWPAQELYRQEPRKEHRDWPTTWRENGGAGKMYGSNPDYPGAGRMITLKDDPIWEAISEFGNPYPPFAFNSGMGLRDITRKEAVALGLIDAKTRIAPQQRDFNAGLEASAASLDEDLRGALEDEGYEITGDKVTLPPAEAAPEPTPAEPAPAASEQPVPVSASLDFDATAPNVDLLRRTQDLVDSVHGDGVLPRLPVDATTKVYDGVAGLGDYDGTHLGINPQASEALQMAGYVHEMGHHLDTYAFGNDPRDWASATLPEMEEWRQAVTSTDAYANLHARHQAALADDSQGELAEYLAYAGQWHEMFARSYAQYIATRAGDWTLLNGIQEANASTDFFQWAHGDFAPVAAAFDDLFRRKGWIS